MVKAVRSCLCTERHLNALLMQPQIHMKSVLCSIHVGDQTGHKLDGNPGLIFKQMIIQSRQFCSWMCSTLLQGQKAVTRKYLRVTHTKNFNWIPQFRTYSHPPYCYMSVILLSDALSSVLWILTQFRDFFMQPYYYLPVILLGVWCSSKCLVYIISVDHSSGWEKLRKSTWNIHSSLHG